VKAKPKKPKEKGKPKRPLSAYNIFFKEQRAKILSQIPDKKLPKRRNNKNPNRSDPHGKISFEEMARKIGADWRTCPEESKEQYEQLARQDKERYEAEKIAWKSQQSAEMTQHQQLLQQQVDSETMREYISHHEEQRLRKVDVKTPLGPSSGLVAGERDTSVPLPDDDESDEEKKPAFGS
jgi:Fe-S cluster assembly scaffold protein SufB